MPPAPDLAGAALAYARLGYRLLPLHHPIHGHHGTQVTCSCDDPGCGAIGKHPRTRHGLADATSDPRQLGRWWRRWPQANIGLVTGEVADVLDVDGPAGHAALRRWAAQYGLRSPGPLVRTGTGWHSYLAATGTGNRAGLLHHVDWRGRGGYVVAPPSRHATGTRYRWLRPLTHQLPAVPEPLRQLIRPAQEQRRNQLAPPWLAGTDHPNGRAALAEELAQVAQAPKGQRNQTLYRARLRLFSLVAGGVLDPTEVRAGLLGAAEASRLLLEELAQTRRTLASAERTGLAHPRGIPARSQPNRSHRPSPRARDGRERGD